MKIKNIFIVLLILLSLIFLNRGFIKKVAALDSSSTSDLNDIEDKINKYQDKLDELQGKEKTLFDQIDYMNNQISLTELKIQNSMAKINKTESEIVSINSDIDDMIKRISKIEDSIEYQNNVLKARLRERYKSKEDSTITILFGGSTLDEIIQKTEYLKVMEIQDNILLDDMNNTRIAYRNQKNLLVQKKTQEEKLKEQLVNEKASLDSLKANLEETNAEKKRLLDVTQNDEARYQQLLADAQRELQQIVNAVGVLKYQKAKDVKAGDVIGIQGNSGYSFGAHLHFGLYKYSSFADIDGWNWYYSNYIDPAKKLEKKTVYWDTGCESPGNRTVGKGDWTWPLKDPTISQGFGHTCWSKVYYGGKDHPALDMHGPAGSLVHASADGKAYFCRNCLGDGGNGVFIFHDGGYMTLYWHLQ